MCERIRRFQMLNTAIFDALEKHLATLKEADGGDGGGAAGVGAPYEHVRCFPPPVHSALVQQQEQ